jgi:uncharacterized membrane protein
MDRRAVWERILNTLSISVLSFVLIGSGLDKILHLEGFGNALRDYRVIPPVIAKYAVYPLIATELFIGIGLLARPWRREAALWAAGLFAFFSAVLSANYWLGGRGICGCWFTITLASGTANHVTQNLMLGGLAFLLWFEGRRTPRFR